MTCNKYIYIYKRLAMFDNIGWGIEPLNSVESRRVLWQLDYADVDNKKT